MDDCLYSYRRKEKRFACSLKAKCQDGDLGYQISCRDISYGGLGLETNTYYPIKGQLQVELNTERSGILNLCGEVVWNKKVRGGWRMGLAFNRTLPIDLKSLL